MVACTARDPDGSLLPRAASDEGADAAHLLEQIVQRVRPFVLQAVEPAVDLDLAPRAVAAHDGDVQRAADAVLGIMLDHVIHWYGSHPGLVGCHALSVAHGVVYCLGVGKLYLADVAAMTGLTENTVGAYHRRGAARFPKPDGMDIDRGHARPWWRTATIRRWLRERPGRGRWKAK